MHTGYIRGDIILVDLEIVPIFFIQNSFEYKGFSDFMNWRVGEK